MYNEKLWSMLMVLVVCIIVFLAGWIGYAKVANALDCGKQVLCILDLDCNFLGSTCLKVGGLESMDRCSTPKSQDYTGKECAQKFIYVLECVWPAGGCGGPQGIEEVACW